MGIENIQVKPPQLDDAFCDGSKSGAVFVVVHVVHRDSISNLLTIKKRTALIHSTAGWDDL